MSNVENDLKSLLPYLNQLERELNRDQQMVRPSPGVNNPQQMYRNLKRMVEDMEQKLVEIPTTTVRYRWDHFWFILIIKCRFEIFLKKINNWNLK